MQDADVRRFMNLFRGNGRSFGQHYPKRPKSSDSITEKSQYTEEHVRAHLDGTVGLGLVPIRDDGTCFFGAIDIDNHGQKEDLDIAQIERKVRALKLPLMPCRSKSGGVHLYLFGNEPLRAEIVRTLLTKWMIDLGIEGSDCVFPKQSRLVADGEGTRALGNWINLPYFKAEDTGRYAVEGGVPMSFDLFLTEAENHALSQVELDALYTNEHSEAPPCLQALITRGFAAGERNIGAYQVAVYLRKKNPDTAKEQSHDLVNRMCADPLPYRELDKTVRSALRKDYGYKCQDEPFKQLCNRDVCRKRKFGIGEAEFEMMQAKDALPAFTDLVKYLNTDPVRYEIKVNGQGVFLTTEELFDFRHVKHRVFERLNVVLPRLKANDWEGIIKTLVETVRIEEAPADTAPVGALALRLEEFIRKANLDSAGDDIRDRERLLRGQPVVQLQDNRRVVMFRSIDFVGFLKVTKCDEVKNKDLWFKASRHLGVTHDRIRVKSRFVNVWIVDAPETDRPDHIPNLKPEF